MTADEPTGTERRAPLTVATCSLGGDAPVQGEGTLSDGREFYFRVRHTSATLYVAGPEPEVDVLDGRRLGVALGGVPNDPHVWSYLPNAHARTLLDMLVWTLGSVEERERHEAAEAQAEESR